MFSTNGGTSWSFFNAPVSRVSGSSAEMWVSASHVDQQLLAAGSLRFGVSVHRGLASTPDLAHWTCNVIAELRYAEE